MSFTAGDIITAYASGSKYMRGTVTSYDEFTGSLVLNITTSVGSGAQTGWKIFQGTNTERYGKNTAYGQPLKSLGLSKTFTTSLNGTASVYVSWNPSVVYNTAVTKLGQDPASGSIMPGMVYQLIIGTGSSPASGVTFSVYGTTASTSGVKYTPLSTAVGGVYVDGVSDNFASSIPSISTFAVVGLSPSTTYWIDAAISTNGWMSGSRTTFSSAWAAGSFVLSNVSVMIL